MKKLLLTSFFFLVFMTSSYATLENYINKNLLARTKYKKMNKTFNLQKLLCFFGFHKVKIINVKYGFGEGGSTEKVKCNVCGKIYTRSRQS